MKKLTPMKAIRAKCLDCSANNFNEVRLCPVKECPLYPYRFGKRPKDDKYIEESTNAPKSTS